MKREVTENLLLNLADHAQILHLALEGPNFRNFDQRLIYLGHLAMCARFFKIVYLRHPRDELEMIFEIEKKSYAFGMPNDERSAIVKESWENLQDALNKYIHLFYS